MSGHGGVAARLSAKGAPALTDGESGLRVLRLLEAATRSAETRWRSDGRRRRLREASQDSRFLVTGGAGTIGSTIVDQLVAAGRRRGRRPGQPRPRPTGEPGRGPGVRAGPSSSRATSATGTSSARSMQGIDVVFHQAAIRITQCAEEPRLALEVLVDGTFDVVEAAADAGVRKVVAASSASVYGLAEEFPTGERHHPYANDTFYGAAKTFNEGMLRSFRAMHGLDYVVLRYFNVYGPRMDVHGLYTEVLVRWMERIAAGPAAADPRRRSADDGLRVHRGHRARERPRRGERRDRRGLQHRQRRPRPACSSWPRRCCG